MVFSIPEYKQSRLRHVKLHGKDAKDGLAENHALEQALIAIDDQDEKDSDIKTIFFAEDETGDTENTDGSMIKGLGQYLSKKSPKAAKSETYKAGIEKWRRDQALQRSNRRQNIRHQFRTSLQQAGADLVKLQNFAQLPHLELQEKLQAIGQEAFDNAYAALGEASENEAVMADILSEITDDQARFSAAILGEHGKQITAEANRIFQRHISDHMVLLQQDPEEFLNAIADLVTYLKDLAKTLSKEILETRLDETVVSYIEAALSGFLKQNRFKEARQFIEEGVGFSEKSASEVNPAYHDLDEKLEDNGIDLKELLEIGDAQAFADHLEKLKNLVQKMAFVADDQQIDTYIELFQGALVAATGPDDLAQLQAIYQQGQIQLPQDISRISNRLLLEHRPRVARSLAGFLAQISVAEQAIQQQEKAAIMRSVTQAVQDISTLSQIAPLRRELKLLKAREQIDVAVFEQVMGQLDQLQQHLAGLQLSEFQASLAFAGKGIALDMRRVENIETLDRLWKKQIGQVMQALAALRQQQAQQTASQQGQQQAQQQIQQKQASKQELAQRRQQLVKNLTESLVAFVKTARAIPTDIRQMIQQVTLDHGRQYIMVARLVGALAAGDLLMGPRSGMTGSRDSVFDANSKQLKLSGEIGGFHKKRIGKFLHLDALLKTGLNPQVALKKLQDFHQGHMASDAVNKRFLDHLEMGLQQLEQRQIDQFLAGFSPILTAEIEAEILADYRFKRAEWFAMTGLDHLAADMALLEVRNIWGMQALGTHPAVKGLKPAVMRYPPELAYSIWDGSKTNSQRDRDWITAQLMRQIYEETNGTPVEILELSLKEEPTSSGHFAPAYEIAFQIRPERQNQPISGKEPDLHVMSFQPNWHQSTARQLLIASQDMQSQEMQTQRALFEMAVSEIAGGPLSVASSRAENQNLNRERNLRDDD